MLPNVFNLLEKAKIKNFRNKKYIKMNKRGGPNKSKGGRILKKKLNGAGAGLGGGESEG